MPRQTTNTVPDLSLLKFISEHPDCTVNDLVAFRGVPKDELARLLDRLEDSGFIMLVPASHERTGVALDNKGRDVVLRNRHESEPIMLLEELADGFGVSINQIRSLTSHTGIDVFKIKGKSHLPVRQVVEMVVSGAFVGGGFWPSTDFREFVCRQLPPPSPSRWAGDPTKDVATISGRDCVISLAPVDEHQRAHGDYKATVRFYGYSDLFHEDSPFDNGFPRYYFDAPFAQAELVAWLRRRDQFVD